MAEKHEQVNANIRAAMSRGRLFTTREVHPAPAPEPGPTQGNAGSGTTTEPPKKHKKHAAINAWIRKEAGYPYDPYAL